MSYNEDQKTTEQTVPLLKFDVEGTERELNERRRKSLFSNNDNEDNDLGYRVIKTTHSAYPQLEQNSKTQHEPISRRLSQVFSSSTKSLRQKGASLLRFSEIYKSRTNKLPYDDEYKNQLVKENNGLRIWYDDYTSIDWIHDHVKERVRLRKLRSKTGIKGYLFNLYDSSQAWIIVSIIGVSCGGIAAFIDVSSQFLTNIRFGYCSKNLLYGYDRCCKGREKNHCFFWKSWSSYILSFSKNLYDHSTYTTVDFIVYFFISITLAMIASIMVYYTKTLQNNNNDINNKKRKQKPYFYFAAGSGIPEVKTILGGFVIRGFLGFKTLIVKTIGLIMSVSSGLSLGKEGPLVHIACCVGNIYSRLFHKYNTNEGKRREVLSASAAAGVAVAFGAPIGGVLFSLEEVSYYFPNKTMLRSFVCALIAALSLKLINPFGTGKTVLFEISFDKNWHVFEIVSFIILGIFGGLYGALFCKLNVMWCRLRRRTWLVKYPIKEVLVVVAITAIINYLNPLTKKGGPELVAELFAECENKTRNDGLCINELQKYYETLSLLVLAILVKFLLTVVTFGIKVPAGVFIPSMCVGACFGRILGLMAQSWQQSNPHLSIFSNCGESGTNCFTPGLYAMIGAAATLGGVTRMTVSLVVIMFELTGSLTYTLPIMLAVVISKWCADALVKASIYENLIELNEYPFLDSRKEHINITALNEIVESYVFDTIQTKQKNNILELNSKINRVKQIGYDDAGFPILNGKALVGYVAAHELEHAIQNAIYLTDDDICVFDTKQKEILENQNENFNDFIPFIDKAPLSVNTNVSVDVVIEMFAKLGLRYLCVTNKGDYIGIIHKKNLLRFLNENHLD